MVGLKPIYCIYVNPLFLISCGKQLKTPQPPWLVRFRASPLNTGPISSAASCICRFPLPCLMPLAMAVTALRWVLVCESGHEYGTESMTGPSYV